MGGEDWVAALVAVARVEELLDPLLDGADGMVALQVEAAVQVGQDVRGHVGQGVPGVGLAVDGDRVGVVGVDGASVHGACAEPRIWEDGSGAPEEHHGGQGLPIRVSKKLGSRKLFKFNLKLF